MRAFYSFLLVLARPLVALRLRWRARKAPAYAERIAERYGHVPQGIGPDVVWVHTVSAGETIAAAPLVRRLSEALATQGVSVLVTTMTPTGSDQVTRLFGSSVAHCYAPYDFPDAVERFLAATKPRALVLMETEIWPNMINKTAALDVPICLINARLSERSARGYARIPTLFGPVLRNLSWIACQYPADASRFRQLGASAAQVDVVGSVKFDVAETPITQAQHAQLAEIGEALQLNRRSVWIAGSTHQGEDEIMLAAHKKVRNTQPTACLLLVPRHPERFDAVYQLAAQRFDGNVRRVSELTPTHTPVAGEVPGDELPAVLVVDVMGLLRPLYTLADVAFIGGSLVDAGGHNPIEAAVASLPMLMGPGRFNFAGVTECFAEAGCLHQVTDVDTLAAQLQMLFGDPPACAEQGASAAALVDAQSGATDRLFDRLTRVATAAAPQ